MNAEGFLDTGLKIGQFLCVTPCDDAVCARDKASRERIIDLVHEGFVASGSSKKIIKESCESDRCRIRSSQGYRSRHRKQTSVVEKIRVFLLSLQKHGQKIHAILFGGSRKPLGHSCSRELCRSRGIVNVAVLTLPASQTRLKIVPMMLPSEKRLTRKVLIGFLTINLSSQGICPT